MISLKNNKRFHKSSLQGLFYASSLLILRRRKQATRPQETTATATITGEATRAVLQRHPHKKFQDKKPKNTNQKPRACAFAVFVSAAFYLEYMIGFFTSKKQEPYMDI
jgi:hypothetical protein